MGVVGVADHLRVKAALAAEINLLKENPEQVGTHDRARLVGLDCHHRAGLRARRRRDAKRRREN